MGIIIQMFQSDIVWEDPEKNIERYQKILENTKNSDIIILPEMFSTGFVTRPSRFLIDFSQKTLDWMKQMAKYTGSAICGSIISEHKNKPVNRFYFVTPEENLWFYDKKHLFAMAGEDDVYLAGNQLLTIYYKGFRIRPFICYDLRFQVWMRNCFYHSNDTFEYDLIIVVANWPQKRISHWETLLAARAIENQAYVCGVNRIGVDGIGIEYNGSTMCIDPLGNVLAKAHDNCETIVEVEIDFEYLQEIRLKFPFAPDWDFFNFE